jgi:hypothetical protein
MSANRLDLLFSDNVAYLPGIQAGVFMGDAGAGAAYVPATQPLEPKLKETGATKAYAPWGENNQFPQDIITAAQKSTELPSLLEWKARAAQGKEVLPYVRVFDEESGKLKDVFCNDPEILAFLSLRTTKRYLREAYNDFFWFWNVFPDMIKSTGGDKIAYIGTFDASHCRWSRQDDKGVVRKCWVSPNWSQGDVKEEDALILDVVDPYSFSAVEELKTKSNIKRVVYPVSYPSPGKT